jgi:(aminoalkyl)phosphonate N-acetyltransferase
LDIEIREMKAVDYPKVVLLWSSELGGNVNLEQFTSRIERMNKNNDYKTFVALLDNEVVGFITTVQTMALEFEIGYLKINGLAVQKIFKTKELALNFLNTPRITL